jgi:hypothetical protein
MASEASHPGTAGIQSKELLAALRAGREGYWPWRVEETHEERELQPVRTNVQRIEEALIASVVWIGARDVVRFALVKLQTTFSSVA